jgi:hypothetical protein
MQCSHQSVLSPVMSPVSYVTLLLVGCFSIFRVPVADPQKTRRTLGFTSGCTQSEFNLIRPYLLHDNWLACKGCTCVSSIIM